MVRKSLFFTFSKYVKRLVHGPINRGPFARHNQRINCFDCRHNSPASFPRGLVRGIATHETTTSKGTFIPSPEQQAIVELCRTQNVIVSARPGAGKTATAEAIVANNTNRPIAVITYSKRLQIGTSSRLNAYPWSDIFTFHAMAGRLFKNNIVVYNDSILHSLRKQAAMPVWTGKPYEIIILDEFQDCTDDLFWLTCVFISAVTHAAGGRAPQIVILGDERQAIYGFRGADARYLSLSSSIMATLSPYPWHHLALSKSFRLSHENSAFVNKVFLGGEEYIVGSHSGPKPVYLHVDIWDHWSIARHLVPLIRNYGPEHTAIIAPHLRTNRPLSKLTNYLSGSHRIPIAAPISDDMPLDDQVIHGKICVTTCHQFKGNERNLVIVYGVDNSYFDFLARDLPDDICPNTTFVALTRACTQLVIVHDMRHPPMPFIDHTELYKTVKFIDFSGKGKIQASTPPGRPLQTGLLLPANVYPSDLARHVLNETIEDICAKHLQINEIMPNFPNVHHINAPDVVLTDSTRDHYEAVSDINGLAVVAAYEYALLGTLTTLGRKAQVAPDASNIERQAIWLCREACKYEAEMSGYKSRHIQMEGHSFNWLVPHLDLARYRLQAQFPENAKLHFEVELGEKRFSVANPLGGNDQVTDLRGRADIVQYSETLDPSAAKLDQRSKKSGVQTIDLENVSLWEIKFVASLSLEHAIQACTYAYLWSNEHNRDLPPRIVLFNVRDGRRWDIVPRDGVASLRSVVEETLVAKYSARDTPTTGRFLKKCARTKAEVERIHRRRYRGI
ncbi:P-loop containing nucleoside triphosphate hydrolase protein [Pleomassaria siparia CBS 279.74]|uniref:P-loop containing nucleoside triphosphate hydrolase protein n=1 Tax=Pleomassaria siparia CBS 279.74 TaxID=1314801 RepID=A0A6G1JVJ0_9PLEO|nr:P-loop containing nucleoside triphosphate hydrolase protein [Pleomassaria siparia CBS 279.74]